MMQSAYQGTFREAIAQSSALKWGLLLILLQGLDALLTSIGVFRFGVGVEGNPLVRSLMEQLGHLPALGLVKCSAILVIVALIYHANKLPWIKNALGAVGAIYILVAILPWTYILFFKPYL